VALFSIAVHSSILLTKPEYYFTYKGEKFKYAPATNRSETDRFTGYLKNKADEDTLYKKMTEFLSAWAFPHDASVIPEPGMINHANIRLENFKGGYVAKRSIQINQTMDSFLKIAIIKNEEQSTILRLYRQATSAKNLYFSILFYWHILTYPHQDDSFTVNFINSFIKKADDLTKDDIESIKTEALFSNDTSNFGLYIKNGVRNSIAHITRRSTHREKNLEIDLLSEERHLYKINSILKISSRKKIFEKLEEDKTAYFFDDFSYYTPEGI